MPKKFPPPTTIGYVTIDGKAVRIDDLPPDEWQGYQKKMMENVGKRMSEYYSGLIAQGLM